MAEFQIASLIFDMGVGAVVGFISGYAAKLILKVFLILAGVYFGSLVYLQQRGVIEINQQNIGNAVPFEFETTGIIPSLSGFLPMGGGFVAGFYLGFRRA
ncbi:hypothetical protein C9439_04935 [archaeon SCG-AAA382B04]|nr:hypothetical protein C9439_04935 [archaeon SCG-AAA382B04]